MVASSSLYPCIVNLLPIYVFDIQESGNHVYFRLRVYNMKPDQFAAIGIAAPRYVSQIMLLKCYYLIEIFH